MDFALTNLEPIFIRYEVRPGTGRRHKPGGKCSGGHTEKCWEEDARDQILQIRVKRIEEAQGIRFLCPLCFERNGHKREGVHGVVCWSQSRGVPDSAHPGPGRWMLVGTGLYDLSLMEEPGKSRSVLLIGGCAWHGYVTNGRVT